jgi:hypothetical protein
MSDDDDDADTDTDRLPRRPRAALLQARWAASRRHA